MADPITCAICGSELEFVFCCYCSGDGGFHDCGEDCCACADPESDLNETCTECNGEGGYLECPALPHQKSSVKP